MLVFGTSHKSAVLYFILMLYRWKITGLLEYCWISSKSGNKERNKVIWQFCIFCKRNYANSKENEMFFLIDSATFLKISWRFQSKATKNDDILCFNPSKKSYYFSQWTKIDTLRGPAVRIVFSFCSMKNKILSVHSHKHFSPTHIYCDLLDPF